MFTAIIYKKEPPSVSLIQRIVNNYNFISNQTKDALSQLGIVGNDVVKVLNMKRSGELRETLGWEKYNKLAAYFQYLR